MREQVAPAGPRAPLVIFAVLVGAISLLLGLVPGLPVAPVDAQAPVELAHAVVDEAGTLGPNQTVTFSVSVTNNSGGSLQNLTLRVATDELVFHQVTPSDPSGSESPGEALDGGLEWAIPLLEAGLTASRRYEVTTMAAFTASEATNRALVFGSDRTQLAETPVTTVVEDPFQSITVTSEPNEPDAIISPGEKVDYTVTVTADQPIAGRVALRFDPDSMVFGTATADVETTPTGWAVEGADLVADDGLPAGENQIFRFTVEADVGFSDEATVAASAIEVELGSAIKRFPIETPLASSENEITVTHARAAPGEAATPGSTVAYLITVSNGDDRAAIENLQVTVVPPAGFTIAGFDPPPQGEPGQSPVWPLDRLAAGDERRFRYEVQIPDEPTGASIGAIEAMVSFDGGFRQAETGQVELAVGAGVLQIDHLPSPELSQLAPSATVLYTVVVRNPTALPVNGIQLRIEADSPALVEGAQPIEADSDRACKGANWCFDLGPGETETRTYRVTADGSFGDSATSLVNVAVVEVKDETDSIVGQPVREASEPSLPLAPPPVAVVDTPTLESGPTFTLTVVFLLLSFVSVTFLVVSRRAQTARSDMGRSLFTVISLLSATLILAFGTNLQSEAISLLAAIAGYVLGQGTADRAAAANNPGGPGGPGGAVPPVGAAGTGPQPGIGPAAGAGGGGVDAEVGGIGVGAVAAGQGLAGEADLLGDRGVVGERWGVDEQILAEARGLVADGGGVVATGVNQLRRMSQEGRITSLSLLSIALLSPVLIVLATVWLVDSTGTFNVTWPTYVSAGAIALLLLVFLSGVAYLSGTDAVGPAPTSSNPVQAGRGQAGSGGGETAGRDGAPETDDRDDEEDGPDPPD